MTSEMHVRALLDASLDDFVTLPRRWLLDVLAGKLAPAREPVAVPPSLYLTVSEAADRIGMSTSWLYKHWSEVPGAKRVGTRALRFHRGELDTWLVHRNARG